MSREGIIMVLAVVVMVSPFVGLPYAWLLWVLPSIGFVICALALSLRVRRQRARAVVVTPQSHEQEPPSL